MKHNLMKKTLSAALAAALALGGMGGTAFAGTAKEGGQTSEFVKAFADPDQKYDPGVRWELPLGNTTKEELERELESFAKAGIGTVEVTATGQPKGEITEGEYAGKDYAEVYGMGTEAWSRTLQIILEKANELGIRVDFHVSVNNGSNKHVPGISPNDASASKELIFVERDAAGEELPKLSEVTPAKKTFVSNVDGSTQELKQNLQAVLLVKVVEEDKSVETYTQLDGSVIIRGGYGVETFDASYDILDFDKTVDLTPLYAQEATEAEKEKASAELAKADLTEGTWRVMAFWWRGDCNAISGVTKYPSYRSDYFSLEGTKALTDYYTNEIFRIGKPGFENMSQLLKENGGDIFADSYGANANWSNDLPEAFQKLTGEEITKYLPALFYADSQAGKTMDETGQGVSSGRKYGFGFDDGTETGALENYRQAMTDLLIEKQLKPMSEYCSSMGLKYRDQVVYATSRLDMIEAAAYVDVPEVESLNNVDSPDYFTAMASTNHLLGKEVISSEHGATMGCYAYPIVTAIDQANRAFAGGINQLLMHYYTYDNLDYPNYALSMWPGFSAMGSFFSDSWRDNSPKWEHINIMTDYFSRMGYVMRSGTVKRDVAVYKESYWWPRHQGILWADEELGKAGYTYDFLSGGALEFDEAVVTDGVLAADTAEYKAFIFDTTDLKECQDVENSKITLGAIEKFAQYVQAGLPIVCVGGYPEKLVGLESQGDLVRFETALKILKTSGKVTVVDSQSDVPQALKQLGVVPAAENLEPSEVISYRTETDDSINYYYLYNRSNDYVKGISDNFFNYVDNIKGSRSDGEDIETQMALTGEGVPYLLDAYTGEITPIADYEVDREGRIIVDVELDVNAATVIALAPEGILDNSTEFKMYGSSEKGKKLIYENGALTLCADSAGTSKVDLSDGSSVTVRTEAPKDAALGPWTLDIVSYTNKNDITAVGNAASEMKYTDITGIQLNELKGWRDLGCVKAQVKEEGLNSKTQEVDLSTISGMGTYTATLTLPKDWSEKDGLVICVGDPYDTVVLTVNGKEVGVDQITFKADISGYVKAGENTLSIETNTTLSNALVHLRPDWYGTAKVNNYGLRSEVTVQTYTKQAVTGTTQELERLKEELEKARAEAAEAAKKAEEADKKAAEAERKAEEAKKNSALAQEVLRKMQEEAKRLEALAEKADREAREAARKAEEAARKAEEASKDAGGKDTRTSVAKPVQKKPVSKKKRQVTVSWKKVRGAAGYQIRYTTGKSFKKAAVKNVAKGSTVKAILKKLSSGKKYYIKVRAYKIVSGKKVYGKDSTVKKVTVK